MTDEAVQTDGMMARAGAFSSWLIQQALTDSLVHRS